MCGRARMQRPARQRGAVLLIMLALISVMFIFAVVAGLNRSSATMALERAQKTATALARAKEALIAYAVTYGEDPSHTTNLVPGFLPCPEMLATSGNEGLAAGSCGSAFVSQLGRLPWRTLVLDAPKDGAGECLWYAVSGTYKNNPNGVSGSTTNSNMMNWDTNGQFAVKASDGVTYLAGAPADGPPGLAVAVIFAPGSSLSGQIRTPVAGTAVCGGDPTSPAAYLESASGINNSVVSGIANATSTFIAGTSTGAFNDQLVYITRADIWNAIRKRSNFDASLRALTRRAAECTAMYGTQNKHTFFPFSIDLADKRLPWASNISLSPTSIPTYAVNASYNDASGLMSGRLSFKVNTADTATSNSLATSISDYGTNSAYIFSNSSYCSYSPDEKYWYDNWKDHLFYAVANRYTPSANHSPMDSCTSSTCLKINGVGNYAAVVIFAGERLSSQSRNTAGNKGSTASYLEGLNPGSINADTGGGNYQAAATSSTFNDIVYAIDTGLGVRCYDGVTNAMVSAPAVPSSPPGPYAACP